MSDHGHASGPNWEMRKKKALGLSVLLFFAVGYLIPGGVLKTILWVILGIAMGLFSLFFWTEEEQKDAHGHPILDSHGHHVIKKYWKFCWTLPPSRLIFLVFALVCWAIGSIPFGGLHSFFPVGWNVFWIPIVPFASMTLIFAKLGKDKNGGKTKLPQWGYAIVIFLTLVDVLAFLPFPSFYLNLFVLKVFINFHLINIFFQKVFFWSGVLFLIWMCIPMKWYVRGQNHHNNTTQGHHHP
jgi:hypothetical protein